MAREILLPKLGLVMEEGTVVLKEPGGHVTKDEAHVGFEVKVSQARRLP